MNKIQKLGFYAVMGVIALGVGATGAVQAGETGAGGRMLGCGFDGACLEKCSQGYGVLYPICVITSRPPPDGE